MPEMDVVGRFDQRCCSPGPVRRVGLGYGNKVLPPGGSTPSERQRLGGLRAEIAEWGSGWHRDGWEDHDGYIGEPVLDAASGVLAAGVERGTDGWRPEGVVEKRQERLKLLAG
jgi:hypothetical protein